jgi:aminopeptidase N
MRFLIILYVSLLAGISAPAQQNNFCDNNTARSWWDVQYYEINLQVDTANGFLSGYVNITANVTGPVGDSLQIDLQEPLKITSVSTFGSDHEMKPLQWIKSSNTYYVMGDLKSISKNDTLKLQIQYEGIPQVAARPPWDGGIVMDRDKKGTRWMGVACQGTGASVWFPCKDFQGDEADKGMQLTMAVPEGLAMIGNGKCLIENKKSNAGKTTWAWHVINPINNYDISFYIGDYVHWSDTLNGVKGKLTLDYWVLRENLSKAKKQFEVVKPMLHCFEEKMGSYPFYEDGYKLVESPYLGMEHQSAVAYGNEYKMGYLGRDRSNTGAGLKFDFIIIHESGHEWFGNNITSYDKADTWIHEGFTTYTETIFAECLLGKEKAFKYQRGKRSIIHNDRPVQGNYNECDEGSGDHYDKAAFMIHMIRLIMDDDTKFFGMLKAMNNQFYHKIITGKEMEGLINEYSGKNFAKVFDQYLRTKQVPELEIKKNKGALSYRWTNCVPGFDMPVLILADGKKIWLYPTTEWRSNKEKKYRKIVLSEDFLVNSVNR